MKKDIIIQLLVICIPLILFGCARSRIEYVEPARVSLSQIDQVANSHTEPAAVVLFYEKHRGKPIEVDGYLLAEGVPIALATHPLVGFHVSPPDVAINEHLIEVEGNIPEKRRNKYRVIGKIMKSNDEYKLYIDSWQLLEDIGNGH